MAKAVPPGRVTVKAAAATSATAMERAFFLLFEITDSPPVETGAHGLGPVGDVTSRRNGASPDWQTADCAPEWALATTPFRDATGSLGNS
ncbi:hypothetical protein GCM10009525_17330 [Streptosporangium amethystogenes subsp. fukuiense]